MSVDVLSDSYLDSLKERILDFPGVVDPVTQHHIFASGMHGRKCDLDQIPDNDELLYDITQASVAKMSAIYTKLPDMIITVANGGNRFADPLNHFLGSKVSVRKTQKNPHDSKDILLNVRTEKALQRTYPELVVVFDDLGTTGSVAATVVNTIERLNVPELQIEVFTPVYRRDHLERLEEIDVAHNGLIRITDDLPTYTKTECRAEHYCKQGQRPIPHGQ